MQVLKARRAVPSGRQEEDAVVGMRRLREVIKVRWNGGERLVLLAAWQNIRHKSLN
jgi:hypothetical protein